LTPPTRRRPAKFFLSGASVLAFLAAAAARFLPVPQAALEARERRFVAEAGRALDADAAALQTIAGAIQRSSGFAGVVDGGGAEVRPSRLFAILSGALPPGPGWGILFLDAGDRAVAWAGDPIEIEEDVLRPGGGLAIAFHASRFTLAWSSPRIVAGERRGLLVVSRRYPTGLLRPDLIEFFGLPGGPTRLRLRAAASAAPGRLVRLAVEEASPDVAADDAARARARVPSLLAAALVMLFGIAARRPGPGLLAARVVLLLGAPRADSGVWQLFRGAGPFDLGLLATPADVFLTGLVALALLRLAWPSRSFPGGPSLPVPLQAALGLPLALLPYLLGLVVGESLPDLFSSMDLVPDDLASWLVQTGGVALVVGAAGASALLWAPLMRRRRPGPLLLSGAALFVAAGLGDGTGLSAALPLLASAAIGLALAWRAGSEATRDLLGRAATAVFLLTAGCVSGGIGLAHGKTRRVDAALRAADASRPPGAGLAAVRAWEERVGRAGLGPWLPAGSRTLVSDLARALWIRGAGDGFPAPGDLLRIRDAGGKVVSAFGLTRPGTEARGSLETTWVPVPLSAEWVRVPWLRETDRDPLLADVASEGLPAAILVERLEYDAAGRSAGTLRADPAELPARLRDEARLKGVSTGQVLTAEGLRRLRVRDRSPGFVAYAAPGEPALLSLGAAIAAAESALPVVFLVLLAGGGRRRDSPRSAVPLVQTYRARLVTLVVLFGALPLAGSVVVVRFALERHSARETERRAKSLLAEGRRALETRQGGVAGPEELNRAASVIGSDLFVYRDGARAFASRALPVTAEIAEGRLAAPVAEALAEGRPEASSPAFRRPSIGPRLVEAAEATGDGRDALAVVVAEDEAARGALDGIILFAVAVALGAFGLGGRAALALGKPIEDLTAAAERIGSGEEPPPLTPPANVDLRRLVEAFQAMGERVRERTASLARERETAVGLLSNLTAAVVLFRREDGAVLLSNPAADDLLPGGTLEEKLSDTSWAPVLEIVDESATRRRLVERRVTVAVGGRNRVFRVVAMELSLDEPGGRALLLLEDLTEFVRADRLGAWVEAVRAVAHDVKNPLTPIRLAAERLLRLSSRSSGVPPETVAESGSSILRQVGILTDRIGRLARFSDPASLEPRPLDAAALKALLSALAADFAGVEGIRFAVEAGESLPAVAADPALVRDALTNLVVNALEAIGARGGTIRLSLEPAELPGGRSGLRFSCADDGPGLPADMFDRLFEPAFSTKSRGSGMGLATVRRAVERQGGTVFARPSEGGGLIVGFVLPAL
jgi:nitrogen-specific signal transduction histidine kinase